MPYARVSVAAEVPEDQVYLFYAMYCLCLGGLLGMAITGDVFNLFVFIEIASLSTYVLIALARSRQALFASYQYLLVGTIGATLYVIGIGLLYLVTGTLNMADMSARLVSVPEIRPVLAALAFITVGIGIKLALFPLHQWLPNAYAYAPSMVTVFLAATATKVSIYVLVRFYYTVFGDTRVLAELPLDTMLIGLSLVAIFAMSLVAVFQPDLKRMFAFSSVAQVGYIMLGVGLANQAALTGALAHLVNHGVTKAALFMLAGGIALRCGGTRFANIEGLARRMPLTAFGLVIGGLSLIGVPATAGFTSKWYLVVGAIEAGQLWIAALIVAGSLIAVAYVWRIVEAAYLGDPGPEAPPPGEMPWGMRISSAVAVALCIVLGLDTTFNVGYAERAVAMLLGTPP
jgi:multicomponent Na+:H+ antiporter subunit D